MISASATARALARVLLPREQRRRLGHLAWRDEGHGYDRLGMHPAFVAMALGLTRWTYERYFRVTSHGADQIPAEGAAILAANHSGILPFDAMMLYADVLRHTYPPRVVRLAADHFVAQLPFVSTLYVRVGAVSGARPTIRRLLDDGELVGVFPEGMPGIGKPYSERYRLQPFRIGHAELAIRHRVPVVPVAIIGAEEQWREIARIRWLHPFGAPYVPIPATPVPLPVHYHIWYGEPLLLHGCGGSSAADDPDTCAAAARRVQHAVQRLVDRGVRERVGVFA